MNPLPWSSIPKGRDAIPVSEDSASPHRFMWALHNKKNYTLLYQTNDINPDKRGLDLPRLQSIDIYTTTSSPSYLAITLLDSSYADIFLDFCHDLITSTSCHSSREDGVRSIVNRCWRWQSLLFKRGSTLLSEQQQQGLFAELFFLLHYLFPILGPTSALEVWKGPYGAFHDFVTPDIDIEVKSFRSDGLPRIKISSEHQLEVLDHKKLYLVCFSMSRDSSAGLSLTSLADQLSNSIATSNPSALDLYQSLLNEAGFSWSHDYENSLWSIVTNLSFYIDKGFPIIARSSLDLAITHVEYHLNPLLLGNFSVPLDSFLPEIK